MRQKIEQTNIRINKLMSNTIDDRKEPDQILDEVESDTELNLQHLLRATNHLKIAQNEFENAKK